MPLALSKKVFAAGTLLAPVPPVMVTCSDGTKDNIITIGWTGIVCTKPPMTYISVRPERFSYEIIKKSGEFCINLATEQLCKAVDLCGVKSGTDTDKFELCGLDKEKASKVSAPIIAQSPLTLECKVKQIIPLGSHDMFLAEIVAVDCDESVIDKNGRIALEKAGLLAYSHGEYYSLGKRLGSFGYSVRKKPPMRKKHR